MSYCLTSVYLQLLSVVIIHSHPFLPGMTLSLDFDYLSVGLPPFMKEQRGPLTLPAFPFPFCSCHPHPQFKEIVLFSGTGW